MRIDMLHNFTAHVRHGTPPQLLAHQEQVIDWHLSFPRTFRHVAILTDLRTRAFFEPIKLTDLQCF